MLPDILIFHTLRWPNAARLAIAFHELGCRVDALSVPDYPLGKLAAVNRAMAYNPLTPLHSIQRAIEQTMPGLIIPCDDAAVVQLLRLYQQTGADGVQTSRILVERSLGRIEGCGTIVARSNLPAIAAETGVRTAPSRLAASRGELREGLVQLGFPAVLKIDYSWSGDGVEILHNQGEAESAFARATGLRPRLSGLKRLLRDRDLELFRQRLRPRRTMVTLQKFIRGREANTAVACWKGEIVASLCAEVIAARGPKQNATVIKIIENEGMLETARRIVRFAGVSGFCGFDFVLDEDSGLPLLIEINARATQMNHLALGAGHDLVAALCAQAAEEPTCDRPVVATCDTIALFPHEWHRDPGSAYLRAAYHDVPWQEPELIRINTGPLRTRRGL